MSYSAREKAWLNTDNYVEWVIFRDEEPMPSLAAITRAVVCFGTVSLDSVDTPMNIWWTDSVTGKVLADGTSFSGNVLRARLGKTPDLVVGEYDSVALVVYDDTSTNGLVVSDSIYVSVSEVCS